MGLSGAQQGKIAEDEWTRDLQKDAREIQVDEKKEGNILKDAIRRLDNNIKQNTPVQLKQIMINKNVTEISDNILNILRMVKRAIVQLNHDDETLNRTYDKIPHSAQTKFNNESLLKHLRHKSKDVLKFVEEQITYWTKNKKNNEINTGFFVSGNLKNKTVRENLIKIYHEDELINRAMLNLISDMFQIMQEKYKKEGL